MPAKIERPSRIYESVVIMHPDTSEQDQKTLFKKNSEIIKSFSGQMHHIDTWGKRRLANPIDKMRVGLFFHSSFTAKGDCVAELERTMRINDSVLRFVHVRLDERKNITQHLQDYRDLLALSREREQEREDKARARKAAAQMRRPSARA
jgi:small subunit ribosomal protein S6